jgi:hypothetical protein
MCVSGDREFRKAVIDSVAGISQDLVVPRTLEDAIEGAGKYHRVGAPLVVIIDGCRSLDKARKQLAGIAKAGPSLTYLLITAEDPEPLLAEFAEIELGVFPKERLRDVDRLVSSLRRDRRGTLL